MGLLGSLPRDSRFHLRSTRRTSCLEPFDLVVQSAGLSFISISERSSASARELVSLSRYSVGLS